MIKRINKYLKEQKDIEEDAFFYEEVKALYIQDTTESYESLSRKDAYNRAISQFNYSSRSQYKSCEDLGVWIRVGDICYIDYGSNYINEAGFQHFGLIVAITNVKAFVIPMTSKTKTYREALEGKQHLYALGKIEGMYRNSTLFLNDARYINTARIIDVKANVKPSSDLFKDIKSKLYAIID